MRKLYFIIPCLFISWYCNKSDKTQEDPVQKSLEYQTWENTPQPKGSAAYLGLGSFAKVLCTAVFESRRDPAEAAKNSGGIILDPEYHAQVNYDVDWDRKQIMVSLGDSVQRSATYYGDQGCIIDGPEGLHFTPTEVVTGLPHANQMEWPMGDLGGYEGHGYPGRLLDSAIEAAFDTSSLTAAFLVIHSGKIILEKYREGINKDTQLESWSMGKSLTATLIGRLLQMGKLTLDEPAPVPEWQQAGDPRSKITIRNLMQMSSGLRFPAHRDPEVKVPLAQLAHMYVYTDPVDVFKFAVNRPLEFVPGSTGRYRNCDPLTLGYIIRQKIEADGGNYWTWPQKE